MLLSFQFKWQEERYLKEKLCQSKAVFVFSILSRVDSAIDIFFFSEIFIKAIFQKISYQLFFRDWGRPILPLHQLTVIGIADEWLLLRA